MTISVLHKLETMSDESLVMLATALGHRIAADMKPGTLDNIVDETTRATLENEFTNLDGNQQIDYVRSTLRELGADEVVQATLGEIADRQSDTRSLGADLAGAMVDIMYLLPLFYMLAGLKLKGKINLGKFGTLDLEYTGDQETLRQMIVNLFKAFRTAASFSDSAGAPGGDEA